MMDSHILFADLCYQDGETLISFQALDEAVHRDDFQFRGFQVLSDHQIPSSARDSRAIHDVNYYKTFAKGKKNAARVMQLLVGSFPASPYPQYLQATYDPSSFVTKTALVGYPRPPCAFQSGASEGMCSFQKVHFRFPAAKISPYSREGSFLSTQYLHFSCPSLQLDETLFSEQGQPTFDHVEVVSGICIYSARIIRSSVREDGAINVQRLCNAPPTLYEMEYLVRSSSAIADVAATIILRNKALASENPARRSMKCKITLDVPTSFHYYQTINELLERGSCTTSEALEWIDAVELRYQQIAEVFKKCVVRELACRGVNPPYGVCISQRTTLAASFIRDSLQDQVPPLFEDVLSKVSSQENGAWQEFYQLLSQKEKPQDFKALGYLLYVFEVIKSAFPDRYSTSKAPRATDLRDLQDKNTKLKNSSRSSVGGSPRHRHLVISLEDTAGRRIYTRAQKLLKNIRSSPDSMTFPTLVEMYMTRRVFINSNETGSNLYLDDPIPGRPILAEAGDGGNGQDCVSLEHIDVIRILYGVECAKNLQKWFAQVGL